PSAGHADGGGVSEGIRTPDLRSHSPSGESENASLEGTRVRSSDPRTRRVREPANSGGAATSVDLPSALRALADAGLPPDALAAAVEALLRAAKRVPAPAAEPRRVETA